MTTLNALIDDVFVLTNRPDLGRETTVAIRKALYKFHAADTFKRDLTVSRVDLDLESTVGDDPTRWVISLSDFARFRRPKVLLLPPEVTQPSPTVLPPLRDWPPGFQRPQEFVEISPDNLFDSYRGEYQNYFFIAGTQLTLKSGWPIRWVDFYYYQWPEFPSDPQDEIGSWIAAQFPDTIIEEAAGTVFRMIGKDEEFNRYASLFAENIQMLRGVDVGENN